MRFGGWVVWWAVLFAFWLLLVDTLAADWGFYRTPGGKAVYFTLECAARP